MTCSKMPNALALSLCTSATGSVNVSCNIGTKVAKYGLIISTSFTSRDVDPKICADHFLLMGSRSLRPRTTMGINRDREAASMSDMKVWLPIFARTPWVCFWFVGSANAVTKSAESFLISGLETRVPISLKTLPVAPRISALTSSAASANFATTFGKQSASCTGVAEAIWLRQGLSTSMQAALTFHRLSSIPANNAGITKEVTPWPSGLMPATIAHAAFRAGAPNLESAKRSMRCGRNGSTKGVELASASSFATAPIFAMPASLPLPSKAALISAIASTEAAVGAASSVVSLLVTTFELALASLPAGPEIEARSASRLA
mmetsp:Transcript_117134/g.373049  ORF Transcript_117134/g.373049 Transcript_117134/m.373049 type:complete len:319 (-) Transcript_117134:360-1316(-)